MSPILAPLQACLNQIANDDNLSKDPPELLSIEARVKNPWRDPDLLRRAWVASESVRELSLRLECGASTATLWLEVYGLREREQAYHGRVEKLQEIDELPALAGGDS